MGLFRKNKPEPREKRRLTPEGEAYLQHVREEMKDATSDHPMVVSLSPDMYEKVPDEKPKQRKRFGLF